MKKLLLLPAACLLLSAASAQNAVNFNVADCNSTTHDLFTELDAGKVIVICWVMPCASCIAPASTDANTVQGYATSDPGRVKFYMVDDYANTNCATLASWASANSITADAMFSNSNIKMSDYGAAGMPKTIVVGGSTHAVFYNQNGTVSVSALQSAINNALAVNVGIADKNLPVLAMNVSPNPSAVDSKISYTLGKTTEVSLDVFNILGEKVKSVNIGLLAAGKQEYRLSTESLSEGVYFIKVTAGNATETRKLTVTH